jgi:hypothetical protein
MLTVSTESIIEAAKSGRIAAHSAQAQARRSDTQHRHEVAKRIWKESERLAAITAKDYLEQILPHLKEIRLSALSAALGVSRPYAVQIRSGKRVPHPRHWQTLARLVGVYVVR